MKLELIRSFHGFRPLCVGGDTLLLARRHILYTARIAGGKARPVCVLPDSVIGRLGSALRITRRLLRHGVHCGLSLGDSRFLVSFRTGIYCLDSTSGEWELERDTSDGFRPLNITSIAGVPGFEDSVCYGEYDGRITHAPIRIFRRDRRGWSAVYTFPAREVDHVHSLVPDRERRCVWILTGDYDDAPGIWMAQKDFTQVQPVLRGEQKYRACTLFPLKEGLLYATDSHLEKNSLRWLDGEGSAWQTRTLRPMAGPCVYACRVGPHFFFSTGVEPGPPSGHTVRDLLDLRPGPGIDGPACEIVGGSPDNGYETLARWSADLLPKRLFQFSAISFPSGAPDEEVLVTYGMGVRGHDDATEIYAIRS